MAQREISPFRQSQLDRAKERQLKLDRTPAPRNKTGLRLTNVFDPVVHQHLQRNPNFRDPGFSDWINRNHPETVVAHNPSGFVGGAGEGGKPRNRFGQIKERFIPGIGWVQFDDSVTMTRDIGDTGVEEHAHG